MKRLLAAACAATLLTGGLTACTVRENPVHTNTNGVTNSKIPMDDTTNNSGTDMGSSGSGTLHSGGTNNSTTDPTTRDSGSVSGTPNNGTANPTTRGSGSVSGGSNNGNGTIYPDASDLARSGYDRMRSDHIWYDGKSNGRYTAYSDGAVSPGGTGNLIQDGKNLGRDLMNGTKNMVDSVRDSVRDLGGVPHGGDVPPYE